MSFVPPEWITKIVSAVATVSGWTFGAFALGLGIVRFLPQQYGGDDLASIRAEWGGWILFAFILSTSLAVAKSGQAATATIRGVFDRRRERQEQTAKELREHEDETRAEEEATRRKTKYEASVLKHLDTLSQEEREVLGHMLHHNQRTMAVSIVHRGFSMLASKGLVEQKTGPLGIVSTAQIPHTVPDFVWEELTKRREQFPYRAPKSTDWMRN